jgi:hypothetical protein
MIEAIIIDYLIGKTSAGNAVYAEKPQNLPARYIIIEKTGGRVSDKIPNATIAIKSISKNSLLEAISLNEEVKAVMDAIVELDSIGSCRLNSDYNFTDQTTKEYRYQAVFDITHY